MHSKIKIKSFLLDLCFEVASKTTTKGSSFGRNTAWKCHSCTFSIAMFTLEDEQIVSDEQFV